jgi:hypothetical protein
MKFTIIFLGLISQIDLHTAGSQRAVLVHSPHPPHEATLRVNPADIKPGTTPTFKRAGNCPAGVICYEIKGEQIELKDGATTATFLESRFLNHVPRLSKVTDSAASNGTVRVKSSVRNGTNFGVASAYVKYAGGRLTVDQVFCDEVRFEPALYAPPTMCVAADVVFTSDPISEEYVELRSDTGKSIWLKSDATVNFANVPLSNPTHPHFEHHMTILDNVHQKSKMVPTKRSCDDVQDTPKPCVKGTPAPRAKTVEATVSRPIDTRSIDYECTGSQWP